MPYRHPPSVTVLSLIVAVAAIPVLAGCPSDPSKSACVVETHEVVLANQTLPGSDSLLLFPEARLDAVSDGFVLLGTAGDSVRWAIVKTDGTVVGDEQVVTVPDHSAGPWVAVAGSTAPRDRVIIAYVNDAATTGEVDLMTFSVHIDGTNPTVPVSSGKIAAGARVAMMSGRAGMTAGVAWARSGQTDVKARLLGGDGLPTGSDLVVASVADSACLRFSPGKADLTLGFVDLSGTPPAPAFVGVEFQANGVPQTPFRLNIGTQLPSCADPKVVPTQYVELVSADKLYGVSWHSSGIGTFFSVYDPVTKQLPSVLVLSDVRVEGELPWLRGVGWLGKSYALFFTKKAGAEVWPIDANGHQQGTLPALPSFRGHIGGISTQPIGTALYATYADYSTAAPDESAGSRLLVKVSCP